MPHSGGDGLGEHVLGVPAFSPSARRPGRSPTSASRRRPTPYEGFGGFVQRSRDASFTVGHRVLPRDLAEGVRPDYRRALMLYREA